MVADRSPNGTTCRSIGSWQICYWHWEGYVTSRLGRKMYKFLYNQPNWRKMSCNVLQMYCGAHGKIKGMRQIICSFCDMELVSQKTRRVDIMKPKCLCDYNVTKGLNHSEVQKLKFYYWKGRYEWSSLSHLIHDIYSTQNHNNHSL
jgi:hypothetical protein